MYLSGKRLKLIKKTKKYATIEVDLETYETMLADKERQDEEFEYWDWFRKNHTKKYWSDEYSDTHYYWVNKKTGEKVPDSQVPKSMV